MFLEAQRTGTCVESKIVILEVTNNAVSYVDQMMQGL